MMLLGGRQLVRYLHDKLDDSEGVTIWVRIKRVLQA